MNILKVYTVDGEVHSYPSEDTRIIGISKEGHLEIAKKEKEGVMKDLTAGYPKGTWRYYRFFKLKGSSNDS